MGYKRTIDATVEPWTLSEVKTYLNVSDTVDDALLTSAIAAARYRCEDFTGRALISQTWKLAIDAVAVADRVWLPRPPTIAITSITTYAPDNTGTVFSSSNYRLDQGDDIAGVVLNSGSQWPTSLRELTAVEILFTAGYGAAASDVPEPLRQGMIQYIKALYAAQTRLYESDEEPGLAAGIGVTLPPQVEGLWAPYKIRRI